MIHFTKDNFEDEVIRSDRPVVIDFWAEWCGPCRMFAPTFEAVAEEMPDIKFGKVNVDEQPELAQQFRVMSIPTIILMKDGRICIGDNDLMKVHLLDSALKQNAETSRKRLVKVGSTVHIDGTAALLDAMCVRQKWFTEIGEQITNR